MSEYTARITWQRGDAAFTDNRYSRGHTWAFDGGVEVPASSSPHSVRLPYSVEAAVDPEEAFVAALSSCHMLTFLYLAAKAGLRVDRYDDNAVGIMEKDAAGKMAVTRVTLRPSIQFSGDRQPSREELDELHHRAHDECYIASSVKTAVTCEPVMDS
jgi:organic hydroperoxide reductase OsmC/OhrA